MNQRWRVIWPLGVGLVLTLLPVPAGLLPNQWQYFAVFAAAIVAMVATPLPNAAVGLIAVSFIGAMRYVEADAANSIRWALSGFAEPTVWLTFGAFLFALGYRQSGLGRRIALLLVKKLGRRTLGLGYALALADLALAPGTPSNTARSGGTIYPIVRQIPALYGSEPGPSARRIGAYLMWTAFASTAVTSSMFVTALVPNATTVAMAQRTFGFEIGWWGFFIGFAPAGLLLLALVPLLAYWVYPPEIRDSPETVEWAAEELRKMGPASSKEWKMAALVLPAIALWITGSNPNVSVPGLGSRFIDPTTVVLVVISLMLVLRVIAWEDVLAEREAWGVLIYFTFVLTLADGLRRIGFVEWLARSAAAPLAGVDPLVAMFALVAIFFWSHYLFASITSHAVAVLPVVLAIGQELPGVPGVPLAMLCIYSLGLMGVISPYATGCAPIYAGSGFIGRGRFWALGLIFGVLFFAVLVGVAGPWVLATAPGR